jgi:hypothetical protein
MKQPRTLRAGIDNPWKSEKESGMNRWRSILGLIAAFLLILSSAAHSILGWKELSTQLAATNAPGDLVLGLRLGWQFGGVVMLALGLMLGLLFLKRFRGSDTPTFPALIVGLAYLAFGGWALVVSRFDLFFLVFIIPGVLFVVASVGGRAKGQ